MDGSRFDCLTRQWATRRTAIGGLIVGLLGLTGLDAEAKRNGKGNRKRKRKRPGDQAAAEQTKRHEAVRAEKKKRKKKCKGGTVKCGKVCVTASTDAQHCGGCGNPCGSGQACVSGVCATTGPGPDACPSGQIRCGELCVDPTSDESHCGGCGQTCQGDLTCLSGTCGCADASDTRCGNDCAAFLSDDDHCGGCGQACQGDLTCRNGSCGCANGTACGTSCVNMQTNDDHCGQCGRACGAGQRCQGGQCVTATCGANETLCNGTCVPSIGGHPCCSQADCGGPTGSANQIFCDETQHQCRCVTNGFGICSRTLDKRGICGACCAGGAGNLNCLGDLGCHGQTLCTCPAGRRKCNGGSDNRCFQHPPNPDGTIDDPTMCPDPIENCRDCTEGGTKPYVCCWSRSCADASGYGPGQGGSIETFCGGCEKCQNGKLCCNNGSGSAPSCKVPVGAGVCPPAGEG